MPKIIGRQKQQHIFQEAFGSNKAELIALYGRRRVGKTFLVKNYFENKKCLFIYVSGLKNGSLSEQLAHFVEALSSIFVPGVSIEKPTSWVKAFKLLTQLINFRPKREKIVIFFDEMPWLATKKSKFLPALDYYWNRHWVHDQRIKLIVCGSTASWIINNIINNKGGLHNRVTRQINLEPFTLSETKEYLRANRINLTDKQILELYLVMGGIPHYLSHISKNLSVTQNIDELAFNKQGLLYKEFDNLFFSLFDKAELYIDLIRIIARYRYGIEQKELFKQYHQAARGGRIVKRLQGLEQAGFIVSFLPKGHKRRGIYYRLVDEYSEFYIKWIEPFKQGAWKLENSTGIWQNLRLTPSCRSWSGYAFETVCFKHIGQIRRALKLDPLSIPTAWRFVPRRNQDEEGAQIDLLFDRSDDSITICEIKYTEKPFIIDKFQAKLFLQKITAFKQATKTDKQIFLVLISATGIKKNIYSEDLFSAIITLDDLFKPHSF